MRDVGGVGGVGVCGARVERVGMCVGCGRCMGGVWDTEERNKYIVRYGKKKPSENNTSIHIVPAQDIPGSRDNIMNVSFSFFL